MARGRVVVDVDRCKGCGLCLTACNQGVLLLARDRINAHGYHPAQLVDPQNHCTGCGVCAVICPEVCMTVYRQERVSRRSTAYEAAS